MEDTFQTPTDFSDSPKAARTEGDETIPTDDPTIITNPSSELGDAFWLGLNEPFDPCDAPVEMNHSMESLEPNDSSDPKNAIDQFNGFDPSHEPCDLTKTSQQPNDSGKPNNTAAPNNSFNQVNGFDSRNEPWDLTKRFPQQHDSWKLNNPPAPKNYSYRNDHWESSNKPWDLTKDFPQQHDPSKPNNSSTSINSFDNLSAFDPSNKPPDFTKTFQSYNSRQPNPMTQPKSSVHEHRPSLQDMPYRLNSNLSNIMARVDTMPQPSGIAMPNQISSPQSSQNTSQSFGNIVQNQTPRLQNRSEPYGYSMQNQDSSLQKRSQSFHNTRDQISGPLEPIAGSQPGQSEGSGIGVNLDMSQFRTRLDVLESRVASIEGELINVRAAQGKKRVRAASRGTATRKRRDNKTG